jgi:hypothetical protein
MVFGAFVVAVIIRFAVPGNVLNLFEEYSSFNQLTSSGNIVQKIHPGSYGIVLVTFLMLPHIIARWADDRDGVMNSLLVMVIAISLVIVICMFSGQTASIGYLVDSMLVACAAGASLLCFGTLQRRLLGKALLGVTIISSLIAIIEFATKTHFLPQAVIALYDGGPMRADGLFVHPLDLALYSVTAIPFLNLTGWSSLTKTAIIAVLVLGIFAAGARVAAIAATAIVIVSLIFARRHRSGIGALVLERMLVLFGILLLIPILWFIASLLGLTERFQQEGLTDDSVMTRIVIFQIFGYMDWTDLMWGVGNEEMFKYASLGLNIASVEDSLIVFVFQFGFIGALLLMGSMLKMSLALSRHSSFSLKLALTVFFLVALSSNTLSVKSPSWLFIIVVAIGFHDAGVAKEPRLARAYLPLKQT